MAAQTHIGRALKRPDPMLTFKWIPKVIVGPQPDLIDTSYVEQISLPMTNVSSATALIGGSYDHFPEFDDTSPFSVSFYSDCEGRALAYLWAWKNQVKRMSGGLYNLPHGPNGFKYSWPIQVLNTKGEPVVEALIKGVWPTDTTPLEFSQDGSSRIILSQTFCADSVDYNFLKLNISI